MNNIIKLLLFSSVDGAQLAPTENNLTQTKLTCQSLQGSQKDTCVGLKSKDQTDFLEKLKNQLESLSDGSKGHIKTVVSIDSYIVKDSSCKAETGNSTKTAKVKGAKKDTDGSDGSDGDSSDEYNSDDDEETRAAKKVKKIYKKENKQAKKDLKKRQSKNSTKTANVKGAKKDAEDSDDSDGDSSDESNSDDDEEVKAAKKIKRTAKKAKKQAKMGKGKDKNSTKTAKVKGAKKDTKDSEDDSDGDSSDESNSDDDEEVKAAKKTRRIAKKAKKAKRQAKNSTKTAKAKKAGGTKDADGDSDEDSSSEDEENEEDDEAVKEAKKDSKVAKENAQKAKKEAAEASRKAKEAKAKADKSLREAQQKAAKDAAESKRKAAQEEKETNAKAAKQAADAKKQAAEEEAEVKKIAKAETDRIKKKELEEEAAAKKKAAEEEAVAKEKEQNEVAKAVRIAKEEEIESKKKALEEEAASKQKAEDEAALAEAAEAKRKEAEAKEAAKIAKEKKKAVKQNKNKTMKTKKSSKPIKAKTADDADSDDDEDTTAAKKDPKKAAEDEDAAAKALKAAEDEAAEKSEADNKKTRKETKAEKRAKAAEEAAEEAETSAKDKKKKANEDADDKESQEEASNAEKEAKEKRLVADAANLKAQRAAAAAKKAHEDSTQCARIAAKDAKAEDAAEKALKEAQDATKDADKATKKAKEAKEKSDESDDDETKVKNIKKPKKKETSSDGEDEKKKKEAEAAEKKAEDAAKAITDRKEKIRKELQEAEQQAKIEAEKADKAAARKVAKEAEEIERKAQAAADKAKKFEEAEQQKAEDEAERKAKQLALEAEDKRKAKLTADEEARKADLEAKEKAARAIRMAKAENQKAIKAKAEKEAAYRAERVAFIDTLSSKVMKGSDKPFVNNEQFYIVKFNDGKVSTLTGKYRYRARTFQDAFERFADLIRPIVMKDTDAEFGLIGNNKLLATTSIFNDNLKDKKVAITGVEYKTDEISQMMIGLGVKEGLLEWPEDLKTETKEFQMISYSKTKKKATLKLMGTNINSAKKQFDIEMKKGSEGILIDGSYKWKYWSSDYNFALQACSQYFFSKGFYLGVIFDETTAGYEMQWQLQEKVDAKIKSITGQFSGDGSVFASQQYFYIWMWSSSTGKVSYASRQSFWRMGDAYSWYISYVTNYLKRDASAEFLLMGNGTPMLSTASWSSEVNKLMMGKAVSQDGSSMKLLFEGWQSQFYMLLKDKKSGEFKNEGLGGNKNTAYKTFGAQTSGSTAAYWGILYHSNGKIYKINGDTSSKNMMQRGDNWGYWCWSEWIMTYRKMWITWVHNEQEASITLKKEEDARKEADGAWRREFASRIMKYGGDLIDNFNGTGYMFAKQEKFIAIRYNVIKSEINYWTFYANNMDQGYENFGKQIKWWATRNYKDIRYSPEEYFLFGNNRLLLSSLSTTNTTKVENDKSMNMTNAVIGYAYDKNQYIPDDGLLDPENYKNFWTLLQDRATNKTTFAKCDSTLNSCTKSFDKATAYNREEPDKGSRGLLIKGSKDSIQRFSVNEEIKYNSTAWSFKWSLYALAGEFITANDEGDFDSMSVPDESSAGFDIKAPYYKGKRLFHSMVNILQSNKRYYQVHGWWNTYYLKGPVTYYGDKTKWWKNDYGNQNSADMVQVLMADVDKYSSKVVMVYQPGQKLNDTRMFLNFGELARIKQYAPNNCTFKVGKGENIKMVSKTLKSGEIVFTDTKTTNWNAAAIQARTLVNSKTSTGEIWLVYTDQKVYNVYKDQQNPLGHLEVLGEWIFESCPDYQKVHPTDVELEFPTIYQK